MTFANPAGLWLLTALIGVVALHLLRPRRSDTVVSSSMLWETDTVGATAASPWQKLTPTLSLLLQMLAVILAALALARPVIRSEAGLSDHTVVVFDASASMAATDGSPDRLAEARQEAIDLWEELPDGGTMSLVVGGPRPRVAVTSTADHDAWVAAVEAVAQTDGPMDLGGAMTLADGLETAEQTIGIILISDGRHDDDDLRALPPGVTHRMVGQGLEGDRNNRAITSLSVTPDLDDEGGETGTMTAVATVELVGEPGGGSGDGATVPVRFDVDGATAAVEEITLDPAEPTTVSVEVPTGDRVVARLVGQDLLAIDDTAYAQARRAEEVSVSIEGASDPFVEALLASLPGVRVVDEARDVPDVTIYVGAIVPTDVSRPFWAIAPPSGFAGVEVAGVIENPAPTLIRTGDRLLAGLDLSTLRVAEAQRLDAPTAVTLVGAEGAPLVLRGRRAGLTFVYTAFDLGQSSLPLDVAFPILGDRILQELAGSTTVPAAVRVGDQLDTPAGRTSVVVDPAGNEVTLAAEGGTLTIDQPGFWTVTPDGGRAVTVAAALPPGESDLDPLPVTPSEPRVARTGEEPPAVDRSLRWLAILALAAVVAVEWWWWRPRAGVPRWQRRGADGLRVLSLACLALALIGFSLPLPAREVSTVFVIDRSDSLGVAGRETADRWVDDAIQARIDAEGSARSAVVASADGSRVDQLLRDRDRTNAATVIEVDGDRTDLASGLRLAGALLPDEAKRRVVVLSDGRATVGDARAEAGDLARRDIPVDYVLIDEAAGSDASIASIQAPGRVAEGEAVVVQAVVESTVAQSAVVTLRRNGEVVGTTEVDLEEGTNTVSLRDTPPTGGLVSYEVSVSVALDDQPRNDVGRTAVEVEGPDRVLVVASTSSTTSSAAASSGGSVASSGDPARSLVRALEAASIEVDQVTPATLPGLDRLAGYRSVVLVDVDAAMLSDRQMLDLVANTRDLGRGLVTIGGPQSYGMGGYRSSALEEVLPVVSDVLDPRRRRTVAEVFALDTSESMGNCHCAENGNPSDRIPGGVTKTDIARAGTARAIAALEPDDEIGILGFDTRSTWLLDLQQIPADDVIEAGLAKATPAGATDLRKTLTDAADQLRNSDAGLKHVILFTDGFTPLTSIGDLVADAEELYAEGITVSVVGTGEGSTRELQQVAQAGGGRFYPGRDLARIPEILVQESVIASRSFINEGEFFPVITARSPVMAGVDSTPALTGFIATTAKPTATTILVVGEEEDPLLATWRAGLGRATSWTSDAGVRWLGDWTAWDGYTDFWARLVRDTFPLDSGGTVRATVDGDRLRVRVEAPADSAAAPVTAVVTDPDGRQRTIDLTPTGGGASIGEIDISSAGNYAVGAGTVGADGTTAIGSDLATLSYAAEYRPGQANEALLAALSDISGGRGAVTPEQAFDGEGLAASPRRIPLAGWLLASGVVAWLAALVLSRLWIAGTAPALTVPSVRRPARLRRRSGSEPEPSTESIAPDGPPTAPAKASDKERSKEKAPAKQPAGVDQAPPAPPPDPEAPPVKPTTMAELLKAKRDRGEG